VPAPTNVDALTQRVEELEQQVEIQALMSEGATAFSGYNTACYREQEGDKWGCGAGGEFEVQSGATLDVQTGATVNLPTLTDNVDITGTLQYGPGNLYPVGYATSGYAMHCAEVTITGTLVITEATHGLSSLTAILESLSSQPGATAGDPFIAYSIHAGTTVTITVAQDDGTDATDPAVIDYCMVGMD